MRVLYARAGGSNRLRLFELPAGVDSVGRVCALLADHTLEICQFPPPNADYVLIRPSQWRGRPLNKLVAYVLRWDLCFEGDCVVARLDGADVPLNFDPFDGKYSPFSVYERFDMATRSALLDDWRHDAAVSTATLEDDDDDDHRARP